VPPKLYTSEEGAATKRDTGVVATVAPRRLIPPPLGAGAWIIAAATVVVDQRRSKCRSAVLLAVVLGLLVIKDSILSLLFTVVAMISKIGWSAEEE